METVEGKEVALGVVLYENAVNEEDCSEIIKKAQEDFSWKKAEISSKKSGKTWQQSVPNNDPPWEVREKERDTDNIFLAPLFRNDIFWFSLSQLIWTYADKYAEANNITFSNVEVPQLLRYKKNEGVYLNHIDTSPEQPRIFSCLIYLNDVELGGETYFDRIDLSIKPKRGTLALFPADYLHSHEAKTPKSGEKFVIATWFNP